MTSTASFGVLESAWQMNLLRPAGETPAAPPMTEDEITDLPFVPRLPEAHALGNDVVARHMKQVKMLTIADGSGNPGEKVPTPALITQFAYPNDSERVFMLTQYVPPQGNTIVYRVAAGVTQQIRVGESEGLLIQGHWHADPGATVANWNPMNGGTVLWESDNHAFSLFGEGVSADTLVALASSV